jgi:serine/threonine protein kinase
MEVGEPTIAIALLTNLLEHSPANPNLVEYYLALAYCQNRQFDQARSVMRSLSVRDLPLGRRYKLGAILQDSRMPELAAEIFDRILVEDPDYQDVAERLRRTREVMNCGGSDAFDQELIKMLDYRYTDVRVVGNGAMGVVFSGWDSKGSRWVALKMLSPFLRDDIDAKRRFLREAKILQALRHESIVETYEVHPGICPYYSMELLTGSTLADLIRTDAPFPIVVVQAVAREVLWALKYCHEQTMVHRDIKPQNILASKDGRLKIIDFGLVKNITSTNLTVAGTVMGTPAYMPPEQIRGEEADPRSDLYSFGVTIYEMLTGRLPFPPSDAIHAQVLTGDYPPPSSLREDLSPAIDQCIYRCLMKEPNERHPSAEAMYDALESAFEDHFQSMAD